MRHPGKVCSGALAALMAIAILAAPAAATVIYNDGSSQTVTGVTADNISVQNATSVSFTNGSAQPDQSSGDLFAIEGTGGSLLTAMNFTVAPNSTAGVARGFQVIDSTLNMTGGNINSIGYVGADGIAGFGASTIHVGGSTVAAQLQPDQTSTFSAGSVAYAVVANDTSKVNLDSGSYSVNNSGGDFAVAVAAYGSSKVILHGGSFTAAGSTNNFALSANQQSEIDLHGGTLSSGGGIELVAMDTSTINLYGSNFSVDGVTVPFGPLLATSGLLTGTLENGDVIAGDNFYRADTATINLVATVVAVPEPSGVLVLVVGGWGMMRRRVGSALRTIS